MTFVVRNIDGIELPEGSKAIYLSSGLIVIRVPDEHADEVERQLKEKNQEVTKANV